MKRMSMNFGLDSTNARRPMNVGVLTNPSTMISAPRPVQGKPGGFDTSMFKRININTTGGGGCGCGK